jgi:hypothetical protein
VDYETWVDGVTLFAAPFYGDVVSVSTPLGFYRLHGRNFSQTGSRPNAARFGREADRFIARLEHLRRILASRQVPARLPDGRKMFFYRERRLYENILEGRHPTLAEILPMLKILLTARRPVKYKASMMLFLTLCLVLPTRRVNALLTYRLKTGHRSALGLLKQMVALSE